MKRSRAVAIVAAGLVVPPFAARAQAPAPYKIGVTWPLTGPFAPIGAEFLKGSQLAATDVNAAHGIDGHPLQLLVEDTQGTPQGGVAAMRKLVEVDGVQAIQTIFTNVVTAQIPLADELKIPTMGSLESPGLFANSQYSFSHAPTWDKALPLMLRYWKQHRLTRIYGLLASSSVGQLQSAALHEKVPQNGGTYQESFLDASATDFRGVIERVREANAQVIMLTGQGSQTEANLIKQIRELGVPAQIWSFSNSYTGQTFRDAVGPYAEGLVFGGLYLDPNLPQSNGFARKYRAVLGYLPSYPAGECYDVIRIFAYAIGKAGYHGPAIRDAIATLKGFPSVLGGTITMGPNHYTEFASFGIWQVKAGKMIRLAATA